MNSANCRSESMRFSSSSEVENRRPTSASGNSLPITAKVCSRSFSSGGSRSIREARIACTVGGIFSWLRARVSFTAPLRTDAPSSNNASTISSMKNGLPSVRSMMSRFNGATSTPDPSSAVHFVGAVLRQRIEPQLRVVSLAVPLMRVLRAIVDQQENLRGADRVSEQIQKRLGLAIDPVQILEDHHQRLVERFAQQDTLDRLERAALADLRIHLRNRVIAFHNPQQRIEVGNGIFQGAIQLQQLSKDLLSAAPTVIFGAYLEIAMQQIDYRQIGTRFSVRDRKGLEHHPARLRDGLELEQQARFADPGLRHRRHDLSVPSFGVLRRMLHRLHLALPPDELGQPAACRSLQPC